VRRRGQGEADGVFGAPGEAGADHGPLPPANTPVRNVAAAALTLAGTLEAERLRWFLWLPVCMGVGIAVYFSLAFEPSGVSVAGVVLAGMALRLVWHRGLAGNLITGALVAGVIGFGLAKLRTEWVRAPVLERTLYRADVRGIVELVEPRPERGERITLRVTSIEGVNATKLPARARIRTMVTTPGLKPGDAIRLRAKIGPPSPPSLPGDFDFARAAYFQRLGATGYALSKAEIETPPVAEGERSWWAEANASWSKWLEALRQTIGERVATALPGERGAIATALITGARGAITETTNEAFRDSGLFHILSISGLHMVVMAGAAFFGVRRLLALVPAIALHYPVKKWAAVAALIAGFAYLNISGGSVATVRSAVMIGIIFLAVLIDRPALAMRNVALSALLILVIVPESLLDAGFQMSFAAVISLIAVYEVLRERQGDARAPVTALRQTGVFFGGIVLSTLIASFSVAPLAAYHFHKTQQFAVLANLIAIPVCNIVVMPSALLALIALPFGLEAAPLMAMGIGIDVMTWTAATVAAIPGAVGNIPAIPQTSLVMMVAGGLWLTLWQTPWRLAGLGIAALGLAVAPFYEHPDVLVGRGGELVAVRAAGGQLAAVPGRHSGFELRRWLENDGDARATADVAAGDVWRCDRSGCIATVKGVTVAAVRHPSALPEDCARARVLVLPFPKPAGCIGPEVVLEPKSFWSGGTHAISIELLDVPASAASPAMGTPPPAATKAARDIASETSAPAMGESSAHAAAAGAVQPKPKPTRLSVETVSSRRGDRPWTVALKPLEPRPAKVRSATDKPGASTYPAPGQAPLDDDDE